MSIWQLELFVGSGDRLADPRVGLGCTAAFALPLICFITDSRRESVPKVQHQHGDCTRPYRYDRPNFRDDNATGPHLGSRALGLSGRRKPATWVRTFPWEAARLEDNLEQFRPKLSGSKPF